MTTLVALSLQSVAIIESSLLTLISLLKAFLKLLQSAKRSLSSGLDSVPSTLWANFAAAVTFLINKIFSLSFKYSDLPFDWKYATVLLLFKQGCPSLVSN